ncbi:MAG: hypothetical protein WCV88_02280 [Patescibacteria group bacterium]|jgi:hypothetical protein
MNILKKFYRALVILHIWTIKQYQKKIVTPCKRLRAYYKFRFVFPKLGSSPIKDLNLYEAKVYSQNGEDGIIKAIFQKIGTTNKYAVEIGVEDGTECNTRYLIQKAGWKSLQLDGSDNNSPQIKQEFITAENINILLKKYAVPTEFDLLSVDIDYNTYWVWKAIEQYSPRVVIVEYNAAFPPTESKAVEYDPNGVWDSTNYFGASLLAFVNLGKLKNYTLIACDNRGVNAFFVRNDLANNFVSKDIIEIYKAPQYGQKVKGKYIGKPVSKKKMMTV